MWKIKADKWNVYHEFEHIYKSSLLKYKQNFVFGIAAYDEPKSIQKVKQLA